MDKYCRKILKYLNEDFLIQGLNKGQIEDNIKTSKILFLFMSESYSLDDCLNYLEMNNYIESKMAIIGCNQGTMVYIIKQAGRNYLDSYKQNMFYKNIPIIISIIALIMAGISLISQLGLMILPELICQCL